MPKLLKLNELAALEKAVRKANRASWSSWVALISLDAEQAALQATTQKIESARTGLQSPRILSAWLVALRTALENSGLLQVLQDDLAGVKVLEVLRLRQAFNAKFSKPMTAGAWPNSPLG